MVHHIGKAGLAAVVMAGVLVGGGQAAAAAPTSCTTQRAGSTGTVLCRAGTGEYRVRVTCAPPAGLRYTLVGPWRTPGTPSSRTCDNGDPAVALAVETRG